jgi:hypothetical protein
MHCRMESGLRAGRPWGIEQERLGEDLPPKLSSVPSPLHRSQSAHSLDRLPLRYTTGPVLYCTLRLCELFLHSTFLDYSRIRLVGLLEEILLKDHPSTSSEIFHWRQRLIKDLGTAIHISWKFRRITAHEGPHTHTKGQVIRRLQLRCHDRMGDTVISVLCTRVKAPTESDWSSGINTLVPNNLFLCHPSSGDEESTSFMVLMRRSIHLPERCYGKLQAFGCKYCELFHFSTFLDNSKNQIDLVFWKRSFSKTIRRHHRNYSTNVNG